jgi:starch phosphorylase
MLPKRIHRLEELANNLWWSWHPQARELFRVLDYPLWRVTDHNPVKQIHEISAERLEAAAADPKFLSLYDSVMWHFDADMSASDTWFATRYSSLLPGPIAYFSAEYAIHNSLPIYAGGLGILAGDLCKEACDVGLPLVAVGFMYPQGYFHQHIAADGRQVEIYTQLDFDETPVNLVLSPKGSRLVAQIQLADKTLHVAVWLVRLGSVNLYLLDTNVDENTPEDRQLSARLYTADREQRIQQEIVLGVGGVRVLRALGIKPSVWHANEGHTAFMMLERISEEVQERNIPFAQALEKVKATSVFTTHTPVAAGHDVFPPELVEKYFQDQWRSLGIDQQTFLRLGQSAGWASQGFNMTVLALKTSSWRNAVSRVHGAVSRKMWHILWPDVPEREVPFQYVTNGIHGPTWLAPEMARLFGKYLGQDLHDLVERQDDPSLWEHVSEIPDEEFWSAHQTLKQKLMGVVHERAQERWADGDAAADQILAMGSLLHPEVLTIAFVRRFTEYKRPALIFYDVERLKRIVCHPLRPVQIIFAGKSHPADFASKNLLREVYTMVKDRDFRGRVAFVEDYDMHMAHYLVQGADVWLNNPRRLQEACGTSGMKASINGVIHLSVPDGWWHEGYNGVNGWAIGTDSVAGDPREEDRADAEALYSLLEKEIVPLYYDTDRRGVPHGWIRVAKEAIRSIASAFCARRMVKEYIERLYIPAAQSVRERKAG